MLIPTGYAKLPSVEGCFNNQVLFGGTVSQLASAMAQLSNCKFLGEAHYHVGQEVSSSIGGMINFGTGMSGTVKTTATYNFLYQTTPLSSHLALLIQYRASNFDGTTVFIDAGLRDTALNSYTGAVLDHGIRFEEGVDLDHERDNLSTAFTGGELISAPTNTTAVPPRPLFVPSANRGEVVNIVIDVSQCLIATVHIYDLLVPEVTP